MTEQYIWVRNWERFQHYKDRNPDWIKFYTELLSNEEYLDLSTHRRGVLHGVWLAFASANRRLRLDPRRISKRLVCRVTMADLNSLNHAGFLAFVASSELAECEQRYSEALKNRKQNACLEVEAEAEKNEIRADAVPAIDENWIGDILQEAERIVASCVGSDANSMPSVLKYARRLPLGDVADVRARCEQKQRTIQWAVGTLKAKLSERMVA